MGAILLASLLGVGLTAAFALPLFDDDDDSPQPRTPGTEDGGVSNEESGQPVEDGLNQMLEVSDGDELFAEDGDDTITNDGVIEDGAQVFAGPGNDQIDVIGDNSLLDGGGGNDTFTLDEQVNNTTVDGSAGDDTITAAASTGSDFIGGAGNDEMTLDFSLTGTEPNFASGGDGLDMIEVNVLASDDPDAVPGTISGGADGDSFIVNSLNPAGPADPDVDPLTLPPSLIIEDFDPEEDRLTILPKPDGEDVAATLVQSGLLEEDGNTTLFTSFAIDRSEDIQTTVITLIGVTGLELPDPGNGEAIFGDVPSGNIEVTSGESEFGTPADDVIVTPDPIDAPTTIWGNAGDDRLEVEGSQMEVHADGGDDEVALIGPTSLSVIDGGRGADTISGTEGNMIAVTGGLDDDEINVVADNSFIGGADGNDVINLDDTVTNTTVQGGAGDDTITAADAFASRFFGGDGNDDMTLDYSNIGAAPNFASGGEGADRIEVDAMASDEAGALPGRIAGGADGDTFVVNSLNASAPFDPANPDDPFEQPTTLIIDDFDPLVDTLTILPKSDGADVAGTYLGSGLMEEDGDTILYARFAMTGPEDVQTTVIELTGVTGLALPDVDGGAAVFGNQTSTLINVASGDAQFGTPEDDVIVTPESIDAPTTIWGNAGDDTLQVEGEEMTVHGGSGNDEITLTGPTSASDIEAGRGADTINAAEPDGLTISGGFDNDELNLDFTADTTAGSLANGGDGDDTLNVEIGTGAIDQTTGIDTVAGGAGADLFELFSNAPFVTPDPDINALDQPIALSIADFDPAEDMLFLTPDASTGADAEFVGSQTREEDGDTLVSMTFVLPDGTEQSTLIRLEGVTNFDTGLINQIVAP